MKIHFISGLPRSGSTLLSALLRQNPRFHAAVTSPVAALWGALLPKMSGASEFGSFFDDPVRARILRGVLESYYAGSPAEVLFDTNRTWTGRLALLRTLYPETRVICCVRDVGAIIDSVERMLRKNPLQTSKIFNFKPGTSVYARAEVLMHSDTGLIGGPWSTLREAWFSEDAARLVVVTYDALTKTPGPTLEKLYAALDEPPFRHDFNDVQYDRPDYDAHLGMPGMHAVERQVRDTPRPPVIPPDLIAKYADASFWRRPELNRKDALVL